MSVSLGFKAKNIEEALEKASSELNMLKKQLKYEILSYGSSGIFGLSGTKKAKIRVHLPEDSAAGEPKGDGTQPDTDPVNVPEKSKPSDDNASAADRAVIGEKPESRTQYSFADDPAEAGRLVLQRIVEYLVAGAEVNMEKNSDGVFFKVSGKDAGILIGKRGQTLDAIQAIVEKAVNRRNQDRMRVSVDIEGYLETRRQNLQDKALRLADKARRLGKPVSLGQMNAYDRRIVHLALQDFSDVQSRSRGEGPLRKLVIFPKKKKPSER